MLQSLNQRPNQNMNMTGIQNKMGGMGGGMIPGQTGGPMGHMGPMQGMQGGPMQGQMGQMNQGNIPQQMNQMGPGPMNQIVQGQMGPGQMQPNIQVKMIKRQKC